MKIIIDIPEEVFDEIYNQNYYSLKGKEVLRVAVRNGTRLQKEHDRLLDRVLETIEEIRNDDSLLGHSRQDDFDLLRMKVKELKK